AESIGSQTPALPYIAPPPSQHCNTLAMIVIIAVMIVVTVYTAGAAAEAFASTLGTAAGGGAAGVAAAGGTVLTGGAVAGVTATEAIASAFVGGVAGSVAGQLTGKAMGVQDHFSLRQAVGAGLGSAFTAGLSGAITGGQSVADLAKIENGMSASAVAGNYARIAGVGAAGYASGYAGNRLAGEEAHFSWATLLASAAGSAMTARAHLPTNAEQTAGQGAAGFFTNVEGGLVNGAVNAGVARALGADAQNGNQIAVDAFGNALANTLTHASDHASATQAAGARDGTVVLPNGQVALQDGVVLSGDGTGPVEYASTEAMSQAQAAPAVVRTFTTSDGRQALVWDDGVITYALPDQARTAMTSLRDNPVSTVPSSSAWETTWGFTHGAWDGFRHVTQATGEFISSELYSFNHEGGFGATQTGQALRSVYGFAQEEINTARSEGISHTLIAQSAKDAADFVRYAVTERSLAEDLQGAQDFASQGIQQAATYVSTHSGAEIGYDLGKFVGEQAPLLVLTDGASTALKVGGEVLDSAASLTNNARRAIGDFVDGLGSGPTIGSPAAQAGRLDFGEFVPNTVTANVGKNSVTWVLDSEGNTVSATGTLRESFSGAARSSAEVRAQADAAASGIAGDQGGHLVAHRFVLDQGSVNLFPQEGNFNMSAFKTLENDYARYTSQGYQVDFSHTLGDFDPLTGRPSSLSVRYEVTDANGNVVDTFADKYLNQSGQVYVRRAH
ncbi:MAG: DNA/RNA non-specific endonuclease, partial [Bryobacteraceae bacterium]